MYAQSAFDCHARNGFDHIDIAVAPAHKIVGCKVPAYGERTVALYAMALLRAATGLVLPSTSRL